MSEGDAAPEVPRGAWVLRPASDLARTFRGGTDGTALLALHPSAPTTVGRALPARGAFGYVVPGSWGHVSSHHVRVFFTPDDPVSSFVRIDVLRWGRGLGIRKRERATNARAGGQERSLAARSLSLPQRGDDAHTPLSRL